MRTSTVRAQNPVVRGFNPDPSIVKVGEDYYLATSTFEWFPGIRLHRSRDLVNWETVGHALDERNGFDMRGIPDSGGVWAPSITYADGQFWLAYSIVRTTDGDNRDLDNYLVTAPSIEGPWSDPIALGSRGFDFSFFHDTDGTHWITGVQWDQRPGAQRFSAIVLEQYLPEHRRTSGNAIRIYSQPTLVEGPNLYHEDGWYWLLLAEGGTGWNHGITMARSRHLTGPYERDPESAILTRRDYVGHELQKAGHGELVRAMDGSWAMVHLASRPIIHGGARFSTLGRETYVQRVTFQDGWLRLASGGHHGEVDIELTGLEAPVLAPPERDDFDATEIDRTRWAMLRAPLGPGTADLSSRPGWLRLRGGQSTSSVFEQSMIAQRVTEAHAVVDTAIDADPRSVREAAGLCAWYDRNAWIWLQLTWDPENGRHLRILERDATTTTTEAFPAPEGTVRMRLRIEGPLAWFDVAGVDENWRQLPGHYPAWKLSDDHGTRLRFTGMFAGVRVEDLDGTGWHADIDYIDARFTDPDAPQR